MEEKQEIKNLLKNIQKGLSVYTIDELNDVISRSIERKNTKKEQIDKIINVVCEDFKITRRILLFSRCRGNIQIARNITYCLIYFNVDVSYSYIANKIFKGWERSVAKAVQEFKKININIKPDKEFLDKYNDLQEKIK